MLCTWKKINAKKKRGWAIRGAIGSCPQVPVDNADKENLNGLYNELTNSINENITRQYKRVC